MGMPRQLLTILTIILLFCFGFSGCAYMSKSGRQQMAYQHYIRKHVRQRQHELARAQSKAKRQMKKDMKSLPPGDPQIISGIERMEPMADPITVSSSGSPQSVPAPNEP